MGSRRILTGIQCHSHLPSLGRSMRHPRYVRLMRLRHHPFRCRRLRRRRQNVQADFERSKQDVYRETRFRQDRAPESWPECFVIITAWRLMGASWSEVRIAAAQAHLSTGLADMDCWMHRLTGYAPRPAMPSPTGQWTSVPLMAQRWAGSSCRT